VSTVEECHLAADFLADAIANNGAAPHTVHAGSWHVDDVEDGVRVSGRFGRYQNAFPAAGVK
jgi:hypothetical protein